MNPTENIHQDTRRSFLIQVGYRQFYFIRVPNIIVVNAVDAMVSQVGTPNGKIDDDLPTTSKKLL